MGFFNGKGQQISFSEGYNYSKWAGKYLVTDGNSLVASTNWGDPLAEFLGMHHTNCGNSGSMITSPSDTMENIKSNIGQNYPAKCDLVILQGDTNGAMDGEVSDQMDGDNPKTTWTARMNYLIRCIRARYPNVLIVMIPDSVRYGYSLDGQTGASVQPYDFGRNKGSLDAMRNLAEYNRINFWNFDGSTPFNPNHLDNYYSRYYHEHAQYGVAQDTVHPYKTYRDAKGKALAHFVAGLVFDPLAPNDAISNWEQFI